MSRYRTRLGYGHTADVEADEFTRILTEQFLDDEEVRFLRTPTIEYCGVAKVGTSTSLPFWTCLRQTRDMNGKVSRWQIQFNVIWDNVDQGWN